MFIQYSTGQRVIQLAMALHLIQPQAHHWDMGGTFTTRLEPGLTAMTKAMSSLGITTNQLEKAQCFALSSKFAGGQQLSNISLSNLARVQPQGSRRVPNSAATTRHCSAKDSHCPMFQNPTLPEASHKAVVLCQTQSQPLGIVQHRTAIVQCFRIQLCQRPATRPLSRAKLGANHWALFSKEQPLSNVSASNFVNGQPSISLLSSI